MIHCEPEIGYLLLKCRYLLILPVIKSSFYRETSPWFSHIFETGAARWCAGEYSLRETARAQTRSWQQKQTNVNNRPFNFITVKHFHSFPAPKTKADSQLNNVALGLCHGISWTDTSDSRVGPIIVQIQ